MNELARRNEVRRREVEAFRDEAVAAHRRRSLPRLADYPLPKLKARIADALSARWGEGRLLDLVCPALATPRNRRLWATLERASASRVAARAFWTRAMETDIAAILPSATVTSIPQSCSQMLQWVWTTCSDMRRLAPLGS